MRIVVTGLIASYPLGGVAWDYLQYVRGFAALGHEVTYLEDTGRWVYDPRARSFTADAGPHVRYLARVLAGARGPAAWAFRDPAGVLHGLDEVALARCVAAADLFLNVSGACWLRDAYRGRGVRAYLDTDPGYSQARLLAADATDVADAADDAGTAGGANAAAAARGARAAADLRYAAATIRAHDVFLTLAENLGAPGCGVPAAGLRWLPTRHPIVLDDWPATPPPAGAPFTTVLSWRTEPTPPVLGGRPYGGKDVQLRRILDLPRRATAPLELAVAGAAPRDALRAAGWRVVDAHDVSATPEAYRDYLARSRGELGVAKEVYVATASGWLSSRTASYLALGRPAIVEDTGIAANLPVGEGLLVFRDTEEAAAALETVTADWPRHARAARTLAAEAFDAGRILQGLLDSVDTA